MKKIFSLVALVGIFALMSFGMTIDKVEKKAPSEELQDFCYNYALGQAEGSSPEQQYEIFGAAYDSCLNWNEGW